MATRPPLTPGRMEVSLLSVPLDVRVAEADALVKVARLSGEEAISILLAARFPKHDPRIEVPAEKAEKVARGKRIQGSVLKLGIV